jgi:DNA recombination protein RmuC
MDSTVLVVVLIFSLMLMGACLLIGVYLIVRKTQHLTDSTPAGLQAQLSIMTEKLARLEPMAQTMSAVQVEMRGLAERVTAVEQRQTVVNQNLGSLTSGLADSTQSLRGELARATTGLAQLSAQAHARQEIEQRSADSIHRLETIIAGTQAKGNAGENILEVVFAKLPVDWQVRDFRVWGKTVEFGLKLPNNLILPIDSKWAATHLLEQFVNCDDPAQQVQLKLEIERRVLEKAREVRKYIDPNVTVPFGVAAVPDAVFDLCNSVQADALSLGVVVISYSLFLPYLLLVFQTMLRAGQSIDAARLDAYVHTIQESTQAMQEEIEGRYSRSLIMLANSRDDLRAHLSKVTSSMTGLQLNSGAVKLPSQGDEASQHS